MIDLGTHKLNLPWRTDPNQPGRIIDAQGIPVAFGSSTTSLKAEHARDDGAVEREYRTTETVSPLRARLIVEAVNNFYMGDENA